MVFAVGAATMLIAATTANFIIWKIKGELKTLLCNNTNYL